MRIVSLNARGGALYDRLAAWLPGVSGDVVCLQEVTRTADLTGWTTFTDGERSLPQRADLFDDVRGLLPGHRARFAASDAGPVIDGGGRRHHQEFGLGLFVAQRFTWTGAQTRFVHGRFTDHDEWPTGGRPRLAQAVRLRGGDDRAVTLVQLHGLRDPAGKADTPARRAQAERLAELVDTVRRPGDLTVVCGDLNLLPSSETFQVLGGLGLVDLVRDAGTRTSYYRKPVRHASYLLVSDPSVVRHFAVLTEPAVSDHCALVLDL